MRRTLLGTLPCLIGCLLDAGKESPPPTGEAPITVDPNSQKITLDPNRVPVVSSCGDGQAVVRRGNGWVCENAASSLAAGPGIVVEAGTVAADFGSGHDVARGDHSHGIEDAALDGGVWPGKVSMDSVQPPRTCAAGQVLSWAGAGWVCVAQSESTEYSAGIGIELDGGTIRVRFGSGSEEVARGSHEHDGRYVKTTDDIPLERVQIEASTPWPGTIAMSSVQPPQTCAAGQVLSWTGAGWVCIAQNETTEYSAGIGIELDGGTIGVRFGAGTEEVARGSHEHDGRYVKTTDDIPLDRVQIDSNAAWPGTVAMSRVLAPLSCGAGDVLAWTGNAWDCVPPAMPTAVSAGEGISLDGGTLSANFGTEHDDVARGDHPHAFADLTGIDGGTPWPGTIPWNRVTGAPDFAHADDLAGLSAILDSFDGVQKPCPGGYGTATYSAAARRWNGGNGCPCTFDIGGLGCSKANPAPSCPAIDRANLDGMYWIDPDGSGGMPSLQLWCDLTANWMLVANIYDSAEDDVPNTIDYFHDGWRQTGNGAWTKTIADIPRAVGTGVSGALKPAAVKAFWQTAGAHALKFCFVSQDGLTETCRATDDAVNWLTLTAAPESVVNPELQTYRPSVCASEECKAAYTYGRLAGLPGSCDDFSYPAVQQYCIPRAAGGIFGTVGAGMCEHYTVNANMGVWLPWGNTGESMVAFRPNRTDDDELGSIDGHNPSSLNWGFRIYLK